MADPNTVYNMATAGYLTQRAEFVTGRVLDLGCGRKPYKRLFPKCEWVGFDIREVGEVIGDAHALPFEDATFDTVVCTDLLHLVATPFAVIAEAARVLKPGGHLLVATRATACDDGETLQAIHPEGLGRMVVAAGLRGIDLRKEGTLVSHEWRDLTGFDKYGFPLPSQVGGWCQQMDSRYPALSCAVAVKEG